MIFWAVVTLMILVVLAVLLRPLLRSSIKSDADDGRLNLSVYKQQLQELEADHERGLVTDDQIQQARMDIERALLSEVPEQSSPPAAVDEGKPLLPTAAFLSIVIITVSVTVYLFMGYPQRMDDTQTAGESMPSPQEMVARLEDRLEQDPQDTQGWLMLARSYSVLGRYQDAVHALERLRGMVGDEPGLLVRLANNMAMANDGRFEGRPVEIIQEVLEQDPDNPSAIWFAGLAANQRGDYRQAINYWERLVPKLDGEPEALERLQEMITDARAALEPETAGKASAQQPQATDAGVTVRVSLSPELQSRVTADDTLFIFARAPAGPAMPLAVVKRRAGELPLEVHLDDADAMMPAGKLSNHKAVTLTARISRTGLAQAESGDLQGSINNVPIPADIPVELTIDSAVP